MEITNQSGQIDEELRLLKTEIKQVLHNVQENVFNAQDPFGELPSADATPEFPSTVESPQAVENGAFTTGPEDQSSISGAGVRDEGLLQASPAELSDFLASAGGPVAAAAGPTAPGLAGEPDPGLAPYSNVGAAPTGAIGDLMQKSPSGAAPSLEMNTGKIGRAHV